MNNTKSNEYIPPFNLRWFVQVLLSAEVKGNKTEATRRTGVRKEVFYYHFNKSPKFRVR